MNIALDYDHTFSADPVFWSDFILLAEKRGHSVVICTARNCELDNIDDEIPEGVEVYYCDGVAKKFSMTHHFKHPIDIWIDDKPENIIHNSTATEEQLAAWRESNKLSKGTK